MGNTTLHQQSINKFVKYAEEGKSDLVARKIQKYGSRIIDEKDENEGSTALLQASRMGHMGIVSDLISIEADIESVDSCGYTPLIWACKEGHKEVVNILLDSRANINTASNGGSTPLIWASRMGHAEIVRLLLQRGADSQALDKDGLTALVWACIEGHADCEAILVAAETTKDLPPHMNEILPNPPTSDRPNVPPIPPPSFDALADSVAQSSLRTPESFLCPITQEIMTDPVICADGHSYERKAIDEWLATRTTSPLTNETLVGKALIPNHALRCSIEEFLQTKARVESELLSLSSALSRSASDGLTGIVTPLPSSSAEDMTAAEVASILKQELRLTAEATDEIFDEAAVTKLSPEDLEEFIKLSSPSERGVFLLQRV